MNDYEKRIEYSYKILSSIYDLMDIIVFPSDKNNPRKALADKLRDEKIKILDVCCGTGSSSFAIAEKNYLSKIRRNNDGH